MQSYMPKNLGRPSNHKQTRYLRYHNNDDQSEYCYIMINIGNKSKQHLKNEFLFKMLPNKTYIVSENCNALLGFDIRNLISPEKIVNLSSINPLPENNFFYIPSNEVSEIPTNGSGNNIISNSGTETQNITVTGESNTNSTNANQSTENVEDNEFNFEMLDIFNTPSPAYNLNDDIDFPCMIDTEFNDPFSNYKLDDFDF